MTPLPKVRFAFEKTNATTEPDIVLSKDIDVHSVFADLIKTAKEKIGSKVRVDISENETREKTGGTLLSPEKSWFLTVELKLTVKVPINEND